MWDIIKLNPLMKVLTFFGSVFLPLFFCRARFLWHIKLLIYYAIKDSIKQDYCGYNVHDIIHRI